MPVDTREPGKTAQTTKTALSVTGTGIVLAGAATGAILGTSIFPGIGTGVGAAVGAIAGLVGGALGIGAAFIDPERAAAKTTLLQQGFSSRYATEYAKSKGLTTAELESRAGRLADQGKADELQAVRQLHAEQAFMETQLQVAEISAGTRTGTVPLWAPVAFVAIVALGMAVTMRRRR